MKTNIKGTVIEAHVEGTTGYADAQAVLAAYGIPTRTDDQGRLQVALRAFAVALGQPHQYMSVDDTFYITSQPLPPLPAEPAGANTAPWHPVTAPITGGPGDRRADLLERIIAQFRVEVNPRYQRNRQGADETYCNIFLWDVTRALGAEVPHWVVGDGDHSVPGRGRELDANGVVLWLRKRGRDFGWRPCDAQDAQDAANQGKPVVAAWLNVGGIGHVAIVRPGQPDPKGGPLIAQAGATNFERGTVAQGFGIARLPAIEYYSHS